MTSNLAYKTIWLWEDDSVQFGNANLYVNIPVQSVNGKTGAVVLTAEDVGALPSDTDIPTDDHINQLINTALAAIPNAAEVAY